MASFGDLDETPVPGGDKKPECQGWGIPGSSKQDPAESKVPGAWGSWDWEGPAGRIVLGLGRTQHPQGRGWEELQDELPVPSWCFIPSSHEGAMERLWGEMPEIQESVGICPGIWGWM